MKDKMEELRKQFEIEWCRLPFSIADDNVSRNRIFNWFVDKSRQLEPSVEPEIVEIEETELFDKEVLIGGDLGYANKTRTKAITISDYGDGYRIRQYVSNGDMDWQRVGNIPMQLPVEPACKWILVNGRLPEVDKRVLVYVEDYHIDKDGTDTDRILFGYLRSSGKIKPDRCFGDFNVTKWMPIPKP
ncbi:MAG: DUF551 domain-containing protein [Ignavibacteriales bacterium]|nr:DUF551 domain-containing protein [Ignavibacteriales bacterium]MBK7380666.1 DUF551 domain-containing protein [Ignavibacteriales bacterium]